MLERLYPDELTEDDDENEDEPKAEAAKKTMSDTQSDDSDESDARRDRTTTACGQGSERTKTLTAVRHRVYTVSMPPEAVEQCRHSSGTETVTAAALFFFFFF